MNQRAKISSNFWKLNAISAIKGFMLIIPVIVPFFRENGLSMREIFVLQSLFALAVTLFEIPSGYFADILGRKISIVAGCCFGSIGYVVYSLSFGFWGFLAGELLLGVGVSFISGSDSALITNSLLELGRGGECKNFFGKYISVGQVSEGTASIIGGFLALVALRFPLYCETAVTFAALPIALSLREPKRHALKMEGNGLRSLLKLVKYSLHDHAEIKWLIIYSSAASASTLTMFWFIQPYLAATGLPISYNGVILAILLFFSAMISRKAGPIEKYFGRKMSLVLMMALPATGYFLLSSLWFPWACLLLLVFYFARGINEPITTDYVNVLISSDIRATVLSVKSFFRRMIFAGFGPIAGWISDAYSLKTALLVSGATFLLIGLISLFFLKKHKAL